MANNGKQETPLAFKISKGIMLATGGNRYLLFRQKSFEATLFTKNKKNG